MDEVGRGSFAGPLVASAVCFNKKLDNGLDEINDSKILSAGKTWTDIEIDFKTSKCFTEIIEIENN